LAPGSYVLEVEVLGARGATATQSIDFEIVP
jgi:hypothetical protein